ncbi:CHAP domain-containing protein [Kitasatospora sp. NPDC006786]|uniref:CHAP domain-containing protein n=1 Tax=unclassified Kitasatospora TaxID=2633591 RepID=UPI0033F87AB2
MAESRLLTALAGRAGRTAAVALVAAGTFGGLGTATAAAALPDGVHAVRDATAAEPATAAATAAEPATAARSALRERIVSIARDQITPAGQKPEKTGACDKYFAYAEGEAKKSRCAKTSWCAAFVDWTWHRAGVRPAPTTLLGRGVGKWGQEHHLFHNRLPARGERPYAPAPGDLVVYGSPAYATGGHVGVVVAVNHDGTIDTVEGNFGDKVTHRHFKPAEARAGKHGISGYVSVPGA